MRADYRRCRWRAAAVLVMRSGQGWAAVQAAMQAAAVQAQQQCGSTALCSAAAPEQRWRRVSRARLRSPLQRATAAAAAQVALAQGCRALINLFIRCFFLIRRCLPRG